VISLDLNNGDIRDFFRAIASTNHLTPEVASSINRKVTVHLKDVPWELALDLVLKSSGLASSVNGQVLSIAMADPALGQDRVLMGTQTISGRITGFNLQNSRSLIQVSAPNADDTMQVWPVEWEGADYLKEIGITANTLKAGDQVIVVGNITRTNTIRVISLQRPFDNFSWGLSYGVRAAPFDGVMFIAPAPQ
jgi:hypothetical protein